jgi:hypothetical protein
MKVAMLKTEIGKYNRPVVPVDGNPAVTFQQSMILTTTAGGPQSQMWVPHSGLEETKTWRGTKALSNSHGYLPISMKQNRHYGNSTAQANGVHPPPSPDSTA